MTKAFLSLVIKLVFLITCTLYDLLMFLWENWCWSILGFKGLSITTGILRWRPNFQNETPKVPTKNALNLGVNVFSTEVLIDDTIFTSTTHNGVAILHAPPRQGLAVWRAKAEPSFRRNFKGLRRGSQVYFLNCANGPLPSSKNPHFQMRLGAQPFLWKWVLFAWEWKMISISKAEHLPSFWNRGPGELGNGLITAAVDFGEKMRYFLLRHNFSEITT